MAQIDNELEIELSQVITRADGTREDLGVVASTRTGGITVHQHRHIFRLAAWLRVRLSPAREETP